MDKISLYIECISTTFSPLHILFSSYSPIKIYRIDMDDPVHSSLLHPVFKKSLNRLFKLSKLCDVTNTSKLRHYHSQIFYLRPARASELQWRHLFRAVSSTIISILKLNTYTYFKMFFPQLYFPGRTWIIQYLVIILRAKYSHH